MTVHPEDRLVLRVFQGSIPITLYLFHGLGGFSHSTYMQRTARAAMALGFSVVLLNHRGCGEGVGLAREPYHSGRSEDLSQVIAYGKSRFPHSFHLAIGFSLSGNALLLLAAGQRAQVQPDMAISVNAPIDLEATARLLMHGFNRLYDLRFARDLEGAVRTRYSLRDELREIKFPLLGSVYDFDALYTAPQGGFRSREDYYSTCSAQTYTQDIQIPTLILTALDDPFVPQKSYRDLKLSASCVLHLEKYGGHMGYIAKNPTGNYRWLDYALLSYMKSLKEGLTSTFEFRPASV